MDLNQTIADLKQENQTMRECLIANDIRVNDLEQYGLFYQTTKL